MRWTASLSRCPKNRSERSRRRGVCPFASRHLLRATRCRSCASGKRDLSELGCARQRNGRTPLRWAVATVAVTIPRAGASGRVTHLLNALRPSVRRTIARLNENQFLRERQEYYGCSAAYADSVKRPKTQGHRQDGVWHRECLPACGRACRASANGTDMPDATWKNEVVVEKQGAFWSDGPNCFNGYETVIALVATVTPRGLVRGPHPRRAGQRPRARPASPQGRRGIFPECLR